MLDLYFQQFIYATVEGNTVDSLTTVRVVKYNGVEVYFGKRKICTFDSKVYLLITVVSPLAQEEAHSISENVTWGRRK